MAEITAEPVAFNTAVEGFVRAFGGRLPPAAQAEVARLGIDFRHLLPAYPLATWEQLLVLAGRALYPELPPEEGWRRVGREFIAGYTQTLLGAAILAMNQVVGPRRALERIGRNLRTGGNFATVTSTVLGPSDVELRSALEPAFAPAWAGRPMVMHHYRHGLFEGALALLGVQGTVERGPIDLQRQAVTYRLRW